MMKMHLLDKCRQINKGKHVPHQKNNNKFESKIEAQCEITKVTRSHFSKFVIALFLLDVMTGKDIW